MKITNILVALILLSSCLTHEDLNLDIKSIRPIELQDGHNIALPEIYNIDNDDLIKVYTDIASDEDLWPIRSMLVLNNSDLIAEHYYKDETDITNPQLIWSCTKQVIGILAGIAIEKKVFESTAVTLGEIFETELQNKPEKRNITLEELLTMRSGIDYENDGPLGETHQLLLQNPDNIVNFVLDRPMSPTMSDQFKYKDGDPQLISSMVQKELGEPTDEWAERVLFSQIGMTNYTWERYKDGQTFGGFGLVTTPRELAKIALLVANKGMCNGKQIVSKAWIEQMTSVQVPKIENDFDASFGYMWWLDNQSDIYYMAGHGGQYAFILPSSNMVVTITSIPNTQGNQQITPDEILPYIYRLAELGM